MKSGLEDVPLKMDCSHVFCAGCIKQWLDSPRRVQCPYRDEDYGIHRSGTSVRIFRLGVSFGLKMSMVKLVYGPNSMSEEDVKEAIESGSSEVVVRGFGEQD